MKPKLDKLPPFLRIGRGLKGPALLLPGLLWLSSCWISVIHAQSYDYYSIDKTTRFEVITVKDGLSTDWITCIHQDKYGFIWIGSELGLNLYDGYTIQVFNSDPGDSTALFNNYIHQILEEDDGTLWFSTKLGISRFNRANRTFDNYIPDAEDLTSPKNNVQKIASDGDHMWIDVPNDLLRLDKLTGTFESFGKNTREPDKGIRYRKSNFIFVDRSGTLWAVSDSTKGHAALSRFNKETGTFDHFETDPADPASFQRAWTKSMLEDSKGTLWFATDLGLFEMPDRTKNEFRHYEHRDGDSSSIFGGVLDALYEDSKGNLWIGEPQSVAK